MLAGARVLEQVFRGRTYGKREHVLGGGGGRGVREGMEDRVWFANLYVKCSISFLLDVCRPYSPNYFSVI